MTTQSGITTKMITNNANDWCYCVLSVTTENYKNKQCQHELQLFIDEVVDLDDNTPLTLNSVYEIPNCLIDSYENCDEKTYEANRKQCGFSNVFEYTLKEWGVLYDVVDIQIDKQTDDSIVYSFRTRSVAPLQWIKNVSLIYGELVFDIEAINEMDLWDSYTATYLNGKEIFYSTHKNKK